MMRCSTIRVSHALPTRWLVAAKLLPKPLFCPESTYKTTTEYLITKTEEQRVRTCYTLLPTAARQQPPLKSGFAAWQPVRGPKKGRSLDSTYYGKASSHINSLLELVRVSDTLIHNNNNISEKDFHLPSHEIDQICYHI